MSFDLDPEFTAALAAMADWPLPPPAGPGDWRAMRARTDAGYRMATAQLPDPPGVACHRHTATAPDGVAVPLSWFVPLGPPRGSAVVHAHPGAMVAGSAELVAPFTADLAARSGVPVLSVDYRLAPEVGGTVLVEDVFAGLAWLVEHAGGLGVDPDRVAVMGESAGGGLAAGVAVLARERGVRLARQLLVYPMLDDRTASAGPALEALMTYTVHENVTAWRTLLGDRYGTDDVPPAVAPARLTDHAGLPPAYVEVGEVDLFRDEAVAHATALWHAGVSTELVVHPGVTHGYDQIAPTAAVSRRALADRVRALRAL